MKLYAKSVVALVGGLVLGVAAGQGLQAQGGPPTYAILETFATVPRTTP